MQDKTRCAWAGSDPLYLDYHDNEWGVPVYNEQMLFEYLILEGMQAGLSWITILKKRAHYRACFANFNPEIIAGYQQDNIERLLENKNIIRNRLKIESIVHNANVFLALKTQVQSFSDYLWRFVDGKPVINHWKTSQAVPATTALSDQLAKDLKQRGFKFVGSTICYAFMQAVGMVNDHTIDCFRHPTHLGHV